MKRNSKSPLVSIIILNWNKPNDTKYCVDSIRQQTYKNYEIIVVDNGSTDNSLEILESIPDIKLIKNPKNRGFTGGHIDGLSASKGKFIFVLNNDAVVDKNYIQKALSILEGDPNIAIVGGRSYSWDGDPDNLSSNSSFHGFQHINPNSLEGIFIQNDYGFTHETNWVSGSAMIIRKSAIEKSGYFYDPMFAYYEESDLFNRLQSLGYKIVYSPDLKIWHQDGASSSSFFQFYQLNKNRFIYGVRNLSSQEFRPFISSSVKRFLKSTFANTVKLKELSQEQKTLNKAVIRSALPSIISLPKTLASRKQINSTDPNGFTLRQRLIIEQTGVSFIFSLNSVKDLSSDLVDFISNVSFSHYNCEFIFVHDDKITNKVKKFNNLDQLSNKKIRSVINRKQSKTSEFNLGWLSAKYDQVWIISNDKSLPSIETIKKALLWTAKETYSLYIPEDSNSFCISRNLLSLYGGMRFSSYGKSLNSLCAFANDFKVAQTHNVSSDISITEDEKKYICSVLQNYKVQQKSSKTYEKIKEKHYRIQQLDNLLRWFFLAKLPIAHKLGRIRNSLFAAVRLQRKKLAKELKLISNEINQEFGNSKNLDILHKDFIAKADTAIKNNNWKETPIFIICRDRLLPLEQLLDWFEKIDMKNIILIDNDSIYPPLIEFFNKTKLQVIRTEKNIGHTVVWNEGFAKTLFPGEYYIVTDPDVIPNEKCPDDVIKYFFSLHKKYLFHNKVGFGLKIDDLPDHYKLKKTVIDWEKQFWVHILEKNVFEAGVDTTFALYKPYTDNYILHPSIRTGELYTARHLPWYVNSDEITAEEAFYRMRASQNITSWNSDEVFERYQKELNKTSK